MSEIEVTYLQTDGIFRPMIPICLSRKQKFSYLSQALLDSGADYNLFPARLGQIIGLSIRSGKKARVFGIGSNEMIVYQHEINLHIGRNKFTTKADFSFSQNVPVLGRQGFFDLFKRIDFDEQRHKIVLHL